MSENLITLVHTNVVLILYGADLRVSGHRQRPEHVLFSKSFAYAALLCANAVSKSAGTVSFQDSSLITFRWSF